MLSPLSHLNEILIIIAIYFLLFGTNFIKDFIADSVIGHSGIDILSISGIITPGTYYEYLKNEFIKRNSIVISQNIYR